MQQARDAPWGTSATTNRISGALMIWIGWRVLRPYSNSHHEDDVLGSVVADGELEELDLILIR